MEEVARVYKALGLNNCNIERVYELANTPMIDLFEIKEQTCGLDEIQDKQGKWVEDVIFHVIKCKECGQKFTVFCNTRKGGGRFAKSGVDDEN